MILRDIILDNKSQEVIEIETLMSGESEKTPDILHSEIEILVSNIENDIVSLESALTDLSGDYNKDLLEKYESLNTESPVINYLVDHWVEVGSNIIDRIIGFIKKLYDLIITNLKKFYVKFLVLFNKQKELALDIKERYEKNKELIKNKLSVDMVMYVNEYGYVDGELYNNLFNSITLNNIVNRLKEIGRVVLITVPKKEVYTDVVSDGKGPLNDMINAFEDNIKNKYEEVFFKNNKDTNLTLNKNIILTDITNEVNNPFLLTSNGKNCDVLDITAKGNLRISKVNVLDGRSKNIKNLDVVIKLMDDMYKYEIKSIVEQDFKLLNTVKKDSDGYLNQAKRYNKVDTYGINLYANNITTTLNFILRYSINRMELSENILKMFRGLEK